MRSVIEQLDRESVLVMYSAGELSAEDRRRVEGMLAGDESMRAELEQLRAAQGMVEEGLAGADRWGRLPVDSRVVERRVGRMIREWQVDRPEVPPTVVQKVVGLKYPWWAYPTTAAAAVVVAFLVWWGNAPLRPYGGSGPIAMNTNTDQQQVDDQSAQAEQPPQDPQTQFVAEMEQSFSHPSHEGIRAAEGELYALSKEGEDWDESQVQQEVNQ